jgi:1,4-beta-D-xylan synthase
MSRRLSLPGGSPVTVTVSPTRGKAGSPVTVTVSPTRGMAGDGSSPVRDAAAVVKGGGAGLTSPAPRHSLGGAAGSSPATLQVSPVRRSAGSRYLGASRDGGDSIGPEFVHYTVHIPPTPERTAHASLAESADAPPTVAVEEVRPQRSYISGTIFTGGLNQATRGHVLSTSADAGAGAAAVSATMSCKMRGCDMPALLGASFGGGSPCDCGFMICRECYLDCVNGAGTCPGCKEPYAGGSDSDSDDDYAAVSSSEERDQLPLTSMAKRFSMVHSVKIPSGNGGGGGGKPAELDHARWLFETKGTYGYGNALWPKDGRGDGSGTGFSGFEDPPNFGGRCRRPLTRKTSVSQAVLSPYRYAKQFLPLN